MVKFILLPVFCVLLVANTGSCQDRITISQLLSFLDRIAVNLKQIRDSIPIPNNLKTFKFQNIYETPKVRALFESLPQSIKDLSKQSTSSTTTTTTTSSPATTPNPETLPSSPPSTAPPKSTPTMVPTITLPTSTTTTAPDPMSDPNTPRKFEGSIRKTVDSETVSDEFRFDTSKIAAWFRETEHAARQKSKFHVRLNASDVDKITEVLNDFTTLANRWGIGFSLYKIKLQLFEHILVNDFPSNIFERFKANLLALPVQVAKRYIVAQTNEIIAKTKRYRAEMQDTQTMDNIIVLLEAVTKLPDLLIRSLTR